MTISVAFVRLLDVGGPVLEISAGAMAVLLSPQWPRHAP
jgi:hypothetical protein